MAGWQRVAVLLHGSRMTDDDAPCSAPSTPASPLADLADVPFRAERCGVHTDNYANRSQTMRPPMGRAEVARVMSWVLVACVGSQV